MNIRLLLCCLILVVLAGCGNAEYATALPEAQITMTPSPAMVSLTPTLTPSPTPSPTLTPTPTPTPLPEALFQAAQRAYHNGDWETAETLYSQLLQIYPLQEGLSVQVTLALGRVHLANAHYAQALEVLTPLLTGSFDLQTTAIAHQIVAEVLMASDQPGEAAPHYAALREFYPILEIFANEKEGDAYYRASVYEPALVHYLFADAVADTAAIRARLQEKIGLCQAALGDYEAALVAYDAAEALLTTESQRARILYQTVETAQLFDDTPEATRRMQRLVDDYPKQSYAYDALIQLVENGIPVDDMQRGLVDYYAGAYAPAVQAFYRVVNADPEHSGAPHYYTGLSFLEAGSPTLALGAFQILIDTHPDDSYYGDAVMGKAEALTAMERVYDATRTYRIFVDEQPEHPLAPEALWHAATLTEDGGNLGFAAELWLELATQYPDDERAPEARFHAGLLYYQAALFQEAQQAWSDLVLWYPQHDRAQAAYFWSGKTYLESGELISATTAFSEAIALDPWSFYGLRAADRQAGASSFPPERTYPAPIYSPEAQNEAELWLASWLNLEPGQSFILPDEVLADPRLERGSLLLSLGYFDAGRAELESLRATYASDPFIQYLLALYYRDIGLYRSSIIAASAVWRQSPSATFDDLPRFIGGLIYPIYYQDLVVQQAENYDLDPLFAFALLRQESLFEGQATSFAAAHGLMQVIPSTGAAIAQALNWPPNYDTIDLYRPHVSVRFGIWYLTQQLADIEDNLFVAMAAYNGGPGNAAFWWKAAAEDEDLFIERISFRETSLYVRLIREHYAKYRWLYANQ
jgi:soluble lytic murein transglycosylase